MINSLKKSIPSIITIFNLMSGCLAILLSFYDVALAGLMIMAAGIFDFGDGLAARFLNAYTDFGKELDSLADIVSFGVAPAFILYQLFSIALVEGSPYFSIDLLSGREIFILSAAFLPAIFTAIRLAKFNVTDDKDDMFKGLPSPAAGIFIASAGFIFFTTESPWIHNLLLDIWFLLAVSAGLSILMVIPVPMFNIKFKDFKPGGNEIRYLFLLPSFILFLFIGITAIPLIITWYVLLSLAIRFIPVREA